MLMYLFVWVSLLNNKATNYYEIKIYIISGFLRKVLGILSFQFLATFIFCTILYLTPGVRGFVQQQ